MPIPSQTGIPYNKLATKSMVMDMRHKCNYKIRKNKISRAITRAFAWSIAFQNPIYPIVASQPSFAVARDISLPASLLCIYLENLPYQTYFLLKYSYIHKYQEIEGGGGDTGKCQKLPSPCRNPLRNIIALSLSFWTDSHSHSPSQGLTTYLFPHVLNFLSMTNISGSLRTWKILPTGKYLSVLNITR